MPGINNWIRSKWIGIGKMWNFMKSRTSEHTGVLKDKLLLVSPSREAHKNYTFCRKSFKLLF